MEDKTRQSFGSTGAECAQPGGLETIQVEQVLGANMGQRVVEFDMTAPDPKPDIEQVIDVYVKDIATISVDVIPGKVIVRGSLAVKVLYVAALPKEPVHAFEQDNVRWTRDIQIDGAQPGMKASADVAIEFIDYDFDPANPRQVHITIVLKTWVRVVATTDMDVYPVSPAGQGEVTGAAEQMASGAAPGFAPCVSVSGPGLPPTAGVSMGVGGTATVTGNNVNVRTGPGTNFPVITQVNRGDTVALKDQAFGWSKVVLSDGVTTGWIAGWLLSTGGAPPKG